ncbi:hypothetical protein CR513_27323, partial [Mucuna pruriens]
MVEGLEFIEKFKDMNLYVEWNKDQLWDDHGNQWFLENHEGEVVDDIALCRIKELLGTDKARDFSLGEDEDVLVVGYEEGSGRICRYMLDPLESQSKASKTWRITANHGVT